MKYLMICSVIIFSTNIYNLHAQSIPITNDTIICIVDTTKSYVAFIENPIERISEYHWRVIIKSHYYDKNPKEKNNAEISFSTAFRGSSWVKEPFVIPIEMKDIKERFTVVTDKYLNERKSLHKLKMKVGIATWDNYNFLIFKQDVENSKEGVVNAHRVLVGYGEVQF